MVASPRRHWRHGPRPTCGSRRVALVDLNGDQPRLPRCELIPRQGGWPIPKLSDRRSSRAWGRRGRASTSSGWEQNVPIISRASCIPLLAFCLDIGHHFLAAEHPGRAHADVRPRRRPHPQSCVRHRRPVTEWTSRDVIPPTRVQRRANCVADASNIAITRLRLPGGIAEPTRWRVTPCCSTEGTLPCVSLRRFASRSARSGAHGCVRMRLRSSHLRTPATPCEVMR